MAKRILVLTNEHLTDADEVPEPLLPLIDEAEEIYVVAPALTSSLQSLAGDGVRVAADERLGMLFDHIHASDLYADGAAGYEDQVAAIADALADFDAELIVLRLRLPDSREEDWREYSVAKRVRSHFGLPTIVLHLDHEGHTVYRDAAMEHRADAMLHAGRS